MRRIQEEGDARVRHPPVDGPAAIGAKVKEVLG